MLGIELGDCHNKLQPITCWHGSVCMGGGGGVNGTFL